MPAARRFPWLLLAVLLPFAPARADDATHWAFRPVTRPAVPEVKNAAWVRNPIDAFIAARHETLGLTPAPEASPRVLIRRLSLDLTGLPPTPQEVEEFEKACSSGGSRPRLAEEAPIERLQASPHHGERWARHWLDVARFAESEGYESNHLRPYAWRYRDYVVRAFNEDRPFSLFLRQQIAGDEMTPYADDNLIATGFLGAARISSNEEDKWRQRNDMLVDVVNATASAFLGLTLNCAQCHNHKFDPLPARDYYRFMGFFVQGQPALLALKYPRLVAEYEKALPPDYERLTRRQQELFASGRAVLEEQGRKKMTPEMLRVLDIPEAKRTDEEELLYRQADLLLQYTPERIEKNIPEAHRKEYQANKAKLAELAKTVPDRPQTFGFYSPATSPNAVETLSMKGFYPLPYEPEKLATARPYLLHGGDVHRRGPALDPGWPAVLGPSSVPADRPRSALADWLTSPDHPLTARVWANRIWHYHFGRGLVATPNDFGVKGDPSSHPELLDWLASELIRSNWSTRHLHRLIVTSSTYRQASRPDAENAARDADNIYLWRWLPRRLEAETIRDCLLAVSGELDRSVGGPSVEDESKSLRRTLYLLQKRERPPEVQGLFDGPSAVTESCPVRHVSTVPLQALYLLNSDFTLDRARTLAQRVRERAGDNPTRQIDALFLLALGRPPDKAERDATLRFLKSRSAVEDGLALCCHALLNVNEFIYIE